jgi:hypothetical protein
MFTTTLHKTKEVRPFKSNISYTVVQEYRDVICNLTGLKITINDNPILLVCVYGPNKTDSDFCRSLHTVLNDNIDVPCVIGGDWNMTYSTGDIDNNIDVLNMLSHPSILRSKELADMCERYQLSDPLQGTTSS